MKFKTLFYLALILVFSFSLFIPAPLAAQNSQDDDPHATGLLPNTPEQEQMIKATWPRVKKVKFNQLGLERINEGRAKKGYYLFDLSLAVQLGQETETEIGESSGVSTLGDITSEGLTHVDNSTLAWFPPIRSQGSLGSCASFNVTYYLMTHSTAMVKGWNAKTGGDAFRFSPKWTYNFINGGANQGTYFSDNFNVIRKHGATTWLEFPYDGADYKSWCLNTAYWKNAISFRTNAVQYITSVSTTGLQQVKDLLADGYVLVIGTYITSWQYKTISNDPSTAEDDAFLGKEICYWLNGTQGAHAMTCIGYNETIWVDVNGNGVVDTGEKGALRIANSWGTGWKDGGYTWLAYDALRAVSQVAGGPSAGRVQALQGDYLYHLTAPASYSPKIVAEFTVNHLTRNQLRIHLGTSVPSAATPSTTWYPSVISLQGGPYAFNGSTTALDGTFAYDFSDILPGGSTPMRYYLGMYDSAAGNAATLKSYKIIDLTKSPATEVAAANVPRTADGAQVYAWVDYTYSDGNLSPVAAISANPLSGPAPLTVNFDGSASYDPDGSIASYAWDFGDGKTGSGTTAGHTYTSAGTYTAKLIVTDNKGATGSDTETITVQQDSTVINAPSGLTLSASGRTVTLRWTDNSTNEEGFYIERGVRTGRQTSYSQIATLGANTTTYADTLTSAGTYYYRVQAFNITTGKTSGYSPEAKIRVK